MKGENIHEEIGEKSQKENLGKVIHIRRKLQLLLVKKCENADETRLHSCGIGGRRVIGRFAGDYNGYIDYRFWNCRA